MRIQMLIVMNVFILLLLLPMSVLGAGEEAALQAGGDRLVEMQYTDGSWGWPLIAPPTYPNILGPITMGLAKAYSRTGDTDHLTGLQKAGTYLLAKTNTFSPSDGYLAAELDSIFGGTTYVDHVTTYYYGPLAAGTYDRNGLGTSYNTAEYVNLIRTARASSGIPNLAAWDLGMGLVGAASCAASTSEWIDGVKAEINELDGAGQYDVIGLAGALYGLAYMGEDFDPDAGEHAAASDLFDLADILITYQITGSGFAESSTNVTTGFESNQETAYSILALNALDRALYLDNIQDASAYLMSDQLPSGGWNGESGGDPADENNEVTGEALWAISTAEIFPVRYGNDPIFSYDDILQSAYDNCTDGSLIEMLEMQFGEVVMCDRNISITLKGGCNESYTGIIGVTTITGNLVITEGKVVAENIVLQ